MGIDENGIQPIQENQDTGASESESKIDLGTLHNLKQEFSSPVLSLLGHYLESTNGRQKKSKTCMLEFRANHKRCFMIFFGIDFLFRFVYLSILLLVIIRALGLIDFLREVIALWPR